MELINKRTELKPVQKKKKKKHYPATAKFQMFGEDSFPHGYHSLIR